MNLASAAANAAQRIAKLDFSADNARIAALNKEIGDFDAAIERGVARNTEIGALLSGKVKVDAGTVADTLLDPEAATELLSPNADLLESERESLQEGLRELRYRREDAVQALAAVKRDAKHRAGSEASELATSLNDMAEAAAEVLLGIFGTVKSLNYAIDNAALRTLQDRLDFAIDGMVGHRRVLEHRAMMEVPGDVVAAFRKIPQQAPAFAMHIADTVSPPIITTFQW